MGWSDKRKTTKEMELEFDRLYRENERKVFSLAWRLTGDEEAAKDIRQKTFLTLHIKLKKVLSHPSPEGWLLKTVHYFAKHYEREQRYIGNHEVPIEVAEQIESPQPIDELEEFLESLPDWVKEKQKKLLVLYHFYGYSLREISGMLGLTYGAVRAQMARLHAKLREHGFGGFG